MIDPFVCVIGGVLCFALGWFVHWTFYITIPTGKCKVDLGRLDGKICLLFSPPKGEHVEHMGATLDTESARRIAVTMLEMVEEDDKA
jgi:hypothetical protein